MLEAGEPIIKLNLIAVKDIIIFDDFMNIHNNIILLVSYILQLLIKTLHFLTFPTVIYLVVQRIGQNLNEGYNFICTNLGLDGT